MRTYKHNVNRLCVELSAITVLLLVKVDDERGKDAVESLHPTLPFVPLHYLMRLRSEECLLTARVSDLAEIFTRKSKTQQTITAQ